MCEPPPARRHLGEILPEQISPPPAPPLPPPPSSSSIPPDLRFKHPFTCTVVGGSQSGKTTLVLDVLQHRDRIIHGHIKNFYWALPEDAAVPQAVLSHDPPFRIIRGPPAPSDIARDSIVVVDDLGGRCQTADIAKLFTVTSHHSRVSVFLILHNQFPRGPYARDIALSTGYNILTKNPRCPQTFRHLAQQLVGQGVKSLYECYCDATEAPYSFFLVDNTQSCPPALRFRSGCCIPREQSDAAASVGEDGFEIFCTPEQARRLARDPRGLYDFYTETE